ncbi:hypothetical protein [Mesobacillus selenatarsenatis]|uniref:C-type cytochrome biogenesis protein CcmI n=1 Tax=Mesobacillus selenatarsenatis (strain DSM 18680 / JCM 14380 / FERM P-15431 / SF-1) TaxID=1321606 RepID=A0A0A8X809_MESS1|nr:hypothetical protein [Mesobacillus selenatarsenatis]GAM15177.1 hypothetical protein SAMD00020551_3333 [Mesobacillus selenatarsenatis SF-1]
MDYLFLIIGSLVIITCFYFIISPFFSSGEMPAGEMETEGEKLTLEQVYSAVNELEMDFLMKKITSEDFEKLKEDYQLLAAEMLKDETEGLKLGKAKHLPEGKKKIKDVEAEAEILRELKKLRQQKG